MLSSLGESLKGDRTRCILLNKNKVDVDKFILDHPKIRRHPLVEGAFFYDENDYQFGKSYLFDNGAYYIIDASSLLTTSFLKLDRGDRVLDMCAAPGGKTITLAMRDKDIEILANDISHKRALTMSSNIEKLGFGNITITSVNPLLLEKRFAESFDVVILDAPCSSSAMFRKSSIALKERSYEKVLSSQREQFKLMSIAHSLVKKGGTIIYSTCSFSKEEDEDVISYALDKFSDIHLEKLPESKYFYKNPEMNDTIHLFPNMFECEGQFIAYLKKDGSKNESKIKRKRYADRSNFIEEYKLSNEFSDFRRIDDRFYATNSSLDLAHLPIIRDGLEVSYMHGKVEYPSFNLAHSIDAFFPNVIELNEDEAKKYLSRQEIKKDVDLLDGFILVKYRGLALGFVKKSANSLKNLYPKGLRKNF
jgi:16S rRNA C967 or C1407 C5-methylase (RsmB/RsmF family)/NOL1/NOP2/fmu family ribosome biogenesis protein